MGPGSQLRSGRGDGVDIEKNAQRGMGGE